MDADQVGDHRGVAVRDVAERPGVHQHGGVLQRLQQVGLDGVAHDHGHRARRLELLGGHRLTVRGVADHDAPEPVAHVLQRRRQGQHRHHLGRGGDVEAGLPGHPVLPGPEPRDDRAQRPVVDVKDPAPGDVVRVQPERVAMEQVVVDHRRERVVRRGDRVHVAGEVEVERLERHHLAVAAARGTALDPEGRAHRGLPDRDRGALADDAHGLPEADGRGRLPLAERGRGDRGDDHVPGPRPVGQLLDGLEVDLRDVLAVGLDAATAAGRSRPRSR